jgi:hypothetical protein
MGGISSERYMDLVLRMVMDRDECCKDCVSTRQVAERFMASIGSFGVVHYSPVNSGSQVVRIRLARIAGSELSYGDCKKTVGCKEFDMELEGVVVYSAFVSAICSGYLRGVRKISKCFLNDDGGSMIGGFGMKDMGMGKNIRVNGERCLRCFSVLTEGSNISGVLGLSEFVSDHDVYSNDIIDIEGSLGIEACRKVLHKELVLVLSGEGSCIDFRHITLLADAMTFLGHVTPVSRHSIMKYCSRPLDKSSFEEPTKILARASMTGSIEPLVGLSSNILLGQYIPVATSSFEIYYDMKI